MDVKDQSLRSDAVGDLLSSALGDDADHQYSDDERNALVARIDDVIDCINIFRKENKISSCLKNNCIIDFLFPSSEGKEFRKWLQITTQCSSEFLLWCRNVIDGQKFVPYSLLMEFVYDTSHLNYLGKKFCAGEKHRSHTWIPLDSFGQAFRWFCFDVKPRRLTSEFMAIFEIRQTMEAKFKALIGLLSISEGVRIKHDLIPRIVRECISKSNFSPPNGATLTQVMHVYDWTDRCIHTMSTDFVWIVWKAFMVCDDFFTPTPRNNGMMSIHDSFELSNKLLEEMRRSFVERVGQYNSKIKEFAVSWGTPEAAIVDDKGRWCKVNPSNEVVINKYFMTKSEGACI